MAYSCVIDRVDENPEAIEDVLIINKYNPLIINQYCEISSLLEYRNDTMTKYYSNYSLNNTYILEKRIFMQNF